MVFKKTKHFSHETLFLQPSLRIVRSRGRQRAFAKPYHISPRDLLVGAVLLVDVVLDELLTGLLVAAALGVAAVQSASQNSSQIC